MKIILSFLLFFSLDSLCALHREEVRPSSPPSELLIKFFEVISKDDDTQILELLKIIHINKYYSLEMSMRESTAQKGKKEKIFLTPLLFATMSKAKKSISILLNSGADPGQTNVRASGKQQSPFSYACERAIASKNPEFYFSIIKLFLEKKSELALLPCMITDFLQETSFVFAVRNGSARLVEILAPYSKQEHLGRALKDTRSPEIKKLIEKYYKLPDRKHSSSEDDWIDAGTSSPARTSPQLRRVRTAERTTTPRRLFGGAALALDDSGGNFSTPDMRVVSVFETIPTDISGELDADAYVRDNRMPELNMLQAIDAHNSIVLNALVLQMGIEQIDKAIKIYLHGKDSIRIPLLFYAVGRGSEVSVRSLLSLGSDANQSYADFFPLSYAWQQNQTIRTKLVSCLLVFHADIRQLTKEGLSAIERAAQEGDNFLCGLLESVSTPEQCAQARQITEKHRTGELRPKVPVDPGVDIALFSQLVEGFAKRVSELSTVPVKLEQAKSARKVSRNLELDIAATQEPLDGAGAAGAGPAFRRPSHPPRFDSDK